MKKAHPMSEDHRTCQSASRKRGLPVANQAPSRSSDERESKMRIDNVLGPERNVTVGWA
jgi:hypothetical protein